MVQKVRVSERMGYSFCPLTGMVLSSRIYKRSPVQFSPPYGDGTYPVMDDAYIDLFSPPYGDGTPKGTTMKKLNVFSPPYGDGTLNISQNIVKWKS